MTTTIPVTIAPDADAFLDENGLRPEFDRLVENTLQNVPDVRTLEATVSPYYDESCEEFIKLNATIAASYDAAHEAEDEWMKWTMVHVPFAVRRRFVLFAHPEKTDAR